MYSHYDELERRERDKKWIENQTMKDWEKLKKTEQRLYKAICDAWKKTTGRKRRVQIDDVDLWVTRDQIARELNSYRLIPYYLKLLDHLSKGRRERMVNGKRVEKIEGLYWIQIAKRSRWRYAAGQKRPAGFEWVYCPRPETMDIIFPPEPEKNPVVPAIKFKPVTTVKRSRWELALDWIHEHFYW